MKQVPYSNIKTYYVDRVDRRALDLRSLGVPEVVVLGYTDYTCAYPPLPEHQHFGVIELAYLESGLQPYKIGDIRFSLAGGEGVLIPPDTLHSSDGQPSYPGKRFWLQLLLPVTPEFSSWMGLDASDATPLIKFLYEPPDGCVRLPTYFTRRMHDVLKLVDCQICGKELKATMLRIKILSLLFDMLQCKTKNLLPGKYNRLQRAMQWAENNLEEPITIAQMATYAELSLSSFKHLFKKYIGISPYAFLLRKRIERARCMLVKGETTVTETAFACGFNSSQHFSATFKRMVGLTPQEVLKLGSIPLPVENDGQ